MKRRMFAASFTLAIAACLGLAAVANAQDTVPLKGYLEGSVTRMPVPPLVQVDIDGEGRATHLGHFTVEVPHLVDPATRTGEGEYQFTAANGDTLTADFRGQSTPIPDTTLLFIEEHATITGGTGLLEPRANSPSTGCSTRWPEKPAAGSTEVSPAHGADST